MSGWCSRGCLSLFVKGENCEFHAHSVTFLGFTIQSGQLSPDPVKVRAKWPNPCYRKQLQQFLCLSNFYWRFLRNYSKVATPITSLTPTLQPFCWTSKAKAAFARLKSLFTSAPILAYPDPNLCGGGCLRHGVAAILSQRYPKD